MLVEEVIVFFKSVSHQLCGDSSGHLELRTTGVRYLTENPERFIESNTETSWLRICLVCQCKEHGLIILSYKPWLMQ